MSNNKYTDIINITVDHFSDLILSWSDNEIGDFNKWLSLLKNVMIFLTKQYPNMTEIEKTDFSVKIVVELCLVLYYKNIINMNEDQITALKTGKLKIPILIIDNPDILRGSVTILNDLLNKMDTNNDGKVSCKECLAFLCPCCK
jgi:hypothetical protein